MSQVKQILRLHQQGKGIKTIAKALSLSKNTVKGYVRKADASNLPIATLLALEDPVLEVNYGLEIQPIKMSAMSSSNLI